MANNIAQWPGEVFQDLPVESVMEGIQQADLETLLAIGWERDGKMFISCTTGEIGEILLLVEQFKKELLGD